MTSTLAPEVLLAGRYRLVHRLASGGMGQVWRAADEILGRPVAVKLLSSEFAGDQAFLDRFRTEARRTAGLCHPGIASVFDYGEIEEPNRAAYLVMELVEGAPLSAVLAREGRLDPERVLDVVAQAALALEAAHRAGVVHRDVKPSNLLIRRDGVVKVTDFGIARAIGEAPRSEIGLVVGTAAYLSPAQVACQPVTTAGQLLVRAGFQVHERTQPNRWVKAGIVLAQDPAAGTRLERGAVVTLTVSTGPAAVAVDPADYLGQPLDIVRTALIRLGLQVAIATAPAGGAPGTVVGIAPSGALRQGDTVTITVAPPPQESSASTGPSSDGWAPLIQDRGKKVERKHRHDNGHGRHR